MRLWSYQMINVLPNEMLVSQWRELIAIKRQWEKGTLNHRLVSYVKNYNKTYFLNYVSRVICEMDNRGIKYKQKYYDELFDFCQDDYFESMKTAEDIRNNIYAEHNVRYFTQCYYNLEEKFDRGIIGDVDFSKIIDLYIDCVTTY